MGRLFEDARSRQRAYSTAFKASVLEQARHPACGPAGSANLERCRWGGRMPPVRARMPLTEPHPRSNSLGNLCINPTLMCLHMRAECGSISAHAAI